MEFRKSQIGDLDQIDRCEGAGDPRVAYERILQ